MLTNENAAAAENAACTLVRLADRPALKQPAAQWFHEKWHIPLHAYLESMDACLAGTHPVPQWYLAVEEGRIIAGMGVIENDFHDRKDLAPNVCAVYTEKDRRCRGIAGALLDFVCADMKTHTDHTAFYERYGLTFLCMVQCAGETRKSRMYVHKN